MFETTEQALEFTFNTLSRPVGAQCSLGKLGQPRGFGGLTAYDLHAQAAMIVSHLKSGRLSPLQYSLIICIYGDGSERLYCRHMLAQHLLDMLPKSNLGISGMVGYVEWYALRNSKASISIREAAKDAEVSRDAMQYWLPRASELLAKLHAQYEFILDADFLNCGIVQKNANSA